MFFLLILFASAQSVPFVTKRVSLHNPIAIDFSGWRPLRDSTPDKPLDDHFLTVPVAVETDAEHVLSESELNQIREHVMDNWKQKPVKSESFPQIRPLVTSLLPKAEVEREQQEEFTFVKMDKKNATEENLFHAYFASKEHIPPEGYIRLTKTEFQNVFKNAEILFV